VPKEAFTSTGERDLALEYRALLAANAKLLAKYTSACATIESLRKSRAEVLGRSDRMHRVLEGDFNLIEEIFGSLSTEMLAMIVNGSATLSAKVVLIGEGLLADSVRDVLRATGREVESAALSAVLPPGPDDVVYAAPAFDPGHYERIHALRARTSPRRVYTLFQLFAPACLFRFVEGVLGYHVQPSDRLLRMMTGKRILPSLARLNERYPLKGKKVLEYGPLDGAMTGNLVALGVGTLHCVEVHMLNVLKVLAAKQMLGWRNVEVIPDDMHTVDGWAYGRYDLAVAHGVYYHSVAPFRFLENLTTLADAVFLGGFCANPARLKRPLVTLEHEGHSYRAQPFRDRPENDGAGIHASGYYFMPDDLIALIARQGFDVEVIDLDESPAHKAGGSYLRVLARRKQPVQ
jgi:hypothetical protein